MGGLGELPQDPLNLESRPGILVVGSSNVGKRTLLSRLLSVDFEDDLDSSSQIVAHGWTINTKYYSADVSVWMAPHLYEGFSIENLPVYNQLAALVMVFDLTDISSFLALQEWVSRSDIQKFEILLCIGNKVDLVPGHPVHAEYRSRLQKQMLGNSSSDVYLELNEYGISEFEGNSLLGDNEPSLETTRRSCLKWCTEHNIEYIETCASNAEFDKCLSTDGDSQGVERLYGALSAHMWPGMLMKSGEKITELCLPKEELSEEESEYEIEYEILSAGSAEPWDDANNEWASSNGNTESSHSGIAPTNSIATQNEEKEMQPSTSMAVSDEVSTGHDEQTANSSEGNLFDFEDLEQLMSEIGNMRDNLRLMPDFQRREMAAKLALKMASMFGDNCDDEEEDM